ncbi:unnamed protein product [[Candida] boidinii]|nr:unnamed protein product [[Candida] boidinii]
MDTTEDGSTIFSNEGEIQNTLNFTQPNSNPTNLPPVHENDTTTNSQTMSNHEVTPQPNPDIATTGNSVVSGANNSPQAFNGTPYNIVHQRVSQSDIVHAQSLNHRTNDHIPPKPLTEDEIFRSSEYNSIIVNAKYPVGRTRYSKDAKLVQIPMSIKNHLKEKHEENQFPFVTSTTGDQIDTIKLIKVFEEIKIALKAQPNLKECLDDFGYYVPTESYHSSSYGYRKYVNFDALFFEKYESGDTTTLNKYNDIVNESVQDYFELNDDFNIHYPKKSSSNSKS